MANWSFTRGRMNTGYQGSEQLIWENHYTVTEQTADRPGKIKLTINVKTDYFWYTWGGASGTAGTTNDYVEYNGQRVTFSTNRTRAQNYEYTATFYVDFSWNKNNITFHVCDRNDTAYLNATAANPSTITASAGYFGQGIPITLTNTVSDVTHTLTVVCAGRTETLLTNSSSKSYTWTPDLTTYAGLVTNASKTTAVITCETFYSGTSMGSTNTSIDVSFLASDVGPSVTSGWVSIAYLNEGAAAGKAVWIQGYSKAQATFDSTKVTLGTGASIAKYTISCNGTDTDVTPPATSGSSAVIPGTSASVICTVTDSRGFTASETFSVTLEPYANPSVVDVTIYRCDNLGQADESGNYFAVTATSLYSSLNNKNTPITFKAYVREINSAYSGNGENLTSGTKRVLGLDPVNPYDPNYTYEIKIEVTDGLSNNGTVLQIMPSLAWAMKFRPTGDGVAFGKAPNSTHSKRLELGPGWYLRIYAANNVDYVEIDYTTLLGLLT